MSKKRKKRKDVFYIYGDQLLTSDSQNLSHYQQSPSAPTVPTTSVVIPCCAICNDTNHSSEKHACDYCPGLHDTDEHDFLSHPMHIFDWREIQMNKDVEFKNLRNGRTDIGKRMECPYGLSPGERAAYCLPGTAVGLNQYYFVDMSMTIPSKYRCRLSPIVVEVLGPDIIAPLIAIVIEYIYIDVYEACIDCGRRGIQLFFQQHLGCWNQHTVLFV